MISFEKERKYMDKIDKINEIAMNILNEKERVKNRKEMKDSYDTCKYNTGYEPRHCLRCDGRNQYSPLDED